MENRYEILLERFMTREITPEERAELEEQLKKDPKLAEQFAWQQNVAGAWNSLENRRLKALLRNEEKNFQSTEGKVIKFDFRRWSAAAAVLLALVAAVWFITRNSAPDPAEFYAAYPDKISYGRGESQAAQEMEAIGLYNAGNYAASAAAFGQLQQTYPDSTIYAFYHGVALVGATKYAEALPVLEPVSRQTRYAAFQTNGLFYLALAQTGAKDYPAARRTLDAYFQRPDAVTYRERAEKLYGKLKGK